MTSSVAVFDCNMGKISVYYEIMIEM